MEINDIYNKKIELYRNGSLTNPGEAFIKRNRENLLMIKQEREKLNIL